MTVLKQGRDQCHVLRFHDLQRHHFLPQRGHFLLLLLLLLVQKLYVVNRYREHRTKQSGIACLFKNITAKGWFPIREYNLHSSLASKVLTCQKSNGIVH